VPKEARWSNLKANATQPSIGKTVDDAMLAIERPFIEVHLSDPSKREPFRDVNFLNDIALESIVGQGTRGYHLALESIARRFGGTGD